MILRTFFTFLYLLIVTPPLSIACIIVIFLGDRRGMIWWRIATFWVNCLLKSCGVTNVIIHGHEKLENIHSAIFMANHISYLDPPVMACLSEKSPLRFFAKHTLARVPLFGQALWATGQIFINRNDSGKAFSNIEKAIDKIKNSDKYFFVFPEGRRSTNDELLPFKIGGFVLAMKTKFPILPVAIAGTREILPSGCLFRQKGPIVLVVGDPIPTNSYNYKSQNKLIAVVRERVDLLQKKAIQIRKELVQAKA
jgi:1-acyl-sn-glycerol-3-phosphate acyltransferase